jgi:hypothetical protein
MVTVQPASRRPGTVAIAAAPGVALQTVSQPVCRIRGLPAVLAERAVAEIPVPGTIG